MCKVVYYTVDSIIVINISGFKVFIFFVVFLQRSVFGVFFAKSLMAYLHVRFGMAF